MRSQDIQPHASNLPQTHLPGGAEPCRFPRYTIFYFLWGSWSLSSPPCPHCLLPLPHQPPLHFSGLVTFQKGSGVLASWQLSGVRADLILGAAVFTQDWRGRGEKEGSQGSLSHRSHLSGP